MESVKVFGEKLREVLNALGKFFIKADMWFDESTKLLSKCTIKKIRSGDTVTFLIK